MEEAKHNEKKERYHRNMERDIEREFECKIKEEKQHRESEG